MLVWMYHTSLHENSSMQQLYLHILIRPGQRHLKESESGQVDLVIILFHSINTWTDEDSLDKGWHRF